MNDTPMPNRPAAPRRRRLGAALLAAGSLAALGGLAGCASMNQITVDVASFGQWPAGRAPGRYAIERLLSQQQGSFEQLRLEAAARAALERAGFQPADAPAVADVLVQVGSREGRLVDPWSDFNWGWRVGGWRGFGPPGPRFGGVGVGVGLGGGWSVGGRWPSDYARDYREVALQLLDRATRQPLIEAHVRYESRYVDDSVLPALYEAALQGFPNLPAGERRVTVSLNPERGAAPAASPAASAASAATK
jgi:hypothetical protein